MKPATDRDLAFWSCLLLALLTSNLWLSISAGALSGWILLEEFLEERKAKKVKKEEKEEREKQSC